MPEREEERSADPVRLAVFYGEHLKREFNYWGVEAKGDQPFADDDAALQHAAWMCNEMKLVGHEWDVLKARRWINFVQGVLASCGIFTLNEIEAQRLGK